jgi:hypothetical protein
MLKVLISGHKNGEARRLCCGQQRAILQAGPGLLLDGSNVMSY